MSLLLAAHAFVTIAMCGVIWFVQVVHYPLFASVGDDRFRAYEARHVRRTTWVVAPLMSVEVALAAWLVVEPPPSRTFAVTMGLALLLAAWLSTWLLQVPCHRRLESGFDAAAARRLVRTNWIRTACWTARAALALWLMLPAA